MRSEPARRPKLNPKEIDERISELTVRILLQAALGAAGHDHMDEAWEAFRQD